MATQNLNVRVEADGRGFGHVTVNGKDAGWARMVGSGDTSRMRITLDVAAGELASLLAHFDARSRLWTMPNGVTFQTEYSKAGTASAVAPRIIEESRSTPVVTRQVAPAGHVFRQGDRRGVCAVCGSGTRAQVHRVAHDVTPAETPAAAPTMDVNALAQALAKLLGQ